MVHVYREWPGNYEVPGIGVPDPWAKRSNRNKGVNDGDADLGQRSFGFSFLRYKFEIARLEGWRDWEEWARGGAGTEMDGGWLYPDEDELAGWSDGNGSRERVVMRIVDSRAAQHSKISMREDKAFIDLLNELGMVWVPASGKGIGSGEDRIIDALSWTRDAEGRMARAPGLTFDPGCVNHIFAMENHMGADGQKGATKEPVDCLRYLFQSGMVEGAPAEGINVMVLDPAPERNWFMGWYRCGGGGGGRDEGGRMKDEGGWRRGGDRGREFNAEAQRRGGAEAVPVAYRRRMSAGPRRW